MHIASDTLEIAKSSLKLLDLARLINGKEEIDQNLKSFKVKKNPMELCTANLYLF